MSPATLPLCLALVLGAATAAPGLAAPAPAPDIRPLHTSGRSMLPAIPARAVLLADYSPAAFDDIAPGRTVTFRHSRAGLVTHRVFRQVAPGVWWTKGDGNRAPDDEYVTRANFHSLVVTPLAPARRPLLAKIRRAAP